MRVGLNCLRTAPNYKGGINSFTFGLIDGLSVNGGGHDYVIFAGPHNRHLFEEIAKRPHFSMVEINENNAIEDRRAIEALSWPIRFSLPFRHVNRLLNGEHAATMDAYADIHYAPYGPSPLFPYTSKPTIYSIHDIQQLHYPDFFSAEQLRERHVALTDCVEHAAIVQASSTHMKEDFTKHFPTLDPSRVLVIYEGVDVAEFAKPPEGVNVREIHNLPEQFLYYPAQLWYHKNHITVLKALARLRGMGVRIPLVMTGAKYPGASDAIFKFIDDNNLADQVHYVGLVSREEIIALYHAARFLITAVLYESSSIPILEAAAAGTAVLASRTPPNIERQQDLQIELFGPTDDVELAQVLSGAWTDDALIARQVEHNRQAIGRFRWSEIARQYVTMFESLRA